MLRTDANGRVEAIVPSGIENPLGTPEPLPITIYSLHPDVVDFAPISKSAGELNVTYPGNDPFTIAGRRVIEPGPLCREIQGGLEYVTFPYSVDPSVGTEAHVEITALQPELAESNLRLNSIETRDQSPIIPGLTLRRPAPEDYEQIFAAPQGSFSLPLELFRYGEGDSFAATWYFAGALREFDTTSTNKSLPMCRLEGTPGCHQVTDADIAKIVQKTFDGVSAVLQAAARVAGARDRKGYSKYLKGCATALRTMKARTQPFVGAYVCAEAPAPLPECTKTKFPRSTLKRIFDTMFKAPSNLKPKVFQKLRSSYNNGFARLIETYPSEVYICRAPAGASAGK